MKADRQDSTAGRQVPADRAESVPLGNGPSSDTLESLVCCPFCGEDDFDMVGLKSHLQHGDCEPFENTELMSRVFR